MVMVLCTACMPCLQWLTHHLCVVPAITSRSPPLRLNTSLHWWSALRRITKGRVVPNVTLACKAQPHSQSAGYANCFCCADHQACMGVCNTWPVHHLLGN
jgi:hypothetical protein